MNLQKKCFPPTNVKWHSDHWPTVTSQPIRLSTNVITLIPTLTFIELWVVSMEHLQRMCMPAGNAYISWFRPFFEGIAFALIVETSFPRLYTNLMTVPNLTFTELRRFPLSIFCDRCGMSGMQEALTLPVTLFRPPIFGLVCAQIVETRIPRTCHVFTRLFTSNTPWYLFGRFCLWGLLITHVEHIVGLKMCGDESVQILQTFYGSEVRQ